MMVEDYEELPVPDLSKLRIDYNPSRLLRRSVLRYFEEIKQKDRKELDIATLKAIGFDHAEKVVDHLDDAYKDVVEDRLVKAAHSLKTDANLEREDESDDEDN
jgi:hypothetical protein